MKKYHKKGAMGEMLGLFVGIGIIAMVLTFLSVMNAKVYSQSESSIEAITNSTVKESLKGSIVNVFTAQQDGTALLPLVVLAVVIGLVLAAIFGVFRQVDKGGSNVL